MFASSVTKTFLSIVLLRSVFAEDVTPKPLVVIDGQWSPWQIDGDIDCCMYGGYERVKRYCSNPLPQNGGRLCARISPNPDDEGRTEYVTQDERWRSCVCDCFPQCDGLTSFCANDTGRPAHCKCYYGKIVPDGADPNKVMRCQDPPDPPPDPPANETCDAMSDSWQTPILVCRIVSSVWVIGWCVAVIVIFGAFCRFTPERVIHLCEELTLIIVIILVAVPFEDMDLSMGGSEGPCFILSFLMQYFFLCTMTYFFLEALHAYSITTYVVPKDGFFHTIINIIIGLGVPAVIMGISLGVAYEFYGKSGCHCFCDMATRQAWVYVTPLVLLFFAVGIAGEAAAQEKYKKLEETDMGQYIHAIISRKGVLMCTPCALAAYGAAILAVHMASPVMWLFYVVFALILGPLVFFYHTMCDYVVGTAIHQALKFMPCYKRWKQPEAGSQAGGEYNDFYQWVTDGRRANNDALPAAAADENEQ